MNETATVHQNVPVVPLDRVAWGKTYDSEGLLVGIEHIKGTWHALSADEQGRLHAKGILVRAMVACPSCARCEALPIDYDPPMINGHGCPERGVQCAGCRYVYKPIFRNWDTRKLFCAAYESPTEDSVKAHKQYLHAQDLAEAMKFFWAQHSVAEVSKLVGIAPVVGFYVPDGKNDRKLVV